MSMALIGLIVLQLHWIQSALKITETQFDQQVYDVITDASKSLERIETNRLIQEIVANEGRISFTTGASENASSSNNQKGNLRVESLEVNDADSSSENAMSADLFGQMTAQMNGNTVDISDSGSNVSVQINNSPYILSEQIPKMPLDSLLKSAFENRGITLPFELGVRDRETSNLIYKSQDFDGSLPIEKAYITNLFPKNDLGYEDADLVLSFSGKRFYLLRSSSTVIILALIFMIIIVVAFTVVVQAFIRQKNLSEIKNDFINNMTHEFKTPIATINLAADSINNPAVLEDRDQLMVYSKIIKEESLRMNDHVEAVLQTSLLDKEQLELKMTIIDLNEVIRNCQKSAELSLEAKRGQLEFNLFEEKLEILGDATHLTNVILNILDNSVKYSSKRPKILISTAREETEVVVSIEDNGIGMGKEFQQKVFEKFYRIPTGNIHTVKGFGLGLSYVKSIIELHRGHVKLKSEAGNGTKFTLFIPIAHES